jgi:glucose-6-phosphate 1-dehydrogenase
MVIFGASGDLTKRKLIPALYNLAKDNLLSKEFAVIGFARNDMSSEQFRDMLSTEIAEFATTTVDPELWRWFSERIYYVSGEFGDPAAFARLSAQLDEVQKTVSDFEGKLRIISLNCIQFTHLSDEKV